MVEEVYDVEDFNSIIVWDWVKLVLVEGLEKWVMVRIGKNLFNEIRVRVEDSIFKVSDRNSCNFVCELDEGIIVFVMVFVDILNIRNSLGLMVENIGRIINVKFVLIFEDREEEDEFYIDGDFNLDNINVLIVIINVNGLFIFWLSGKFRNGIFGFFDGDVRIEVENLEVEVI